MSTFRQDLVFGVRMLLARPGFTLAAVLSLALGIGANTTIFSLINVTLLADLPYPGQERLAVLWTSRTDRPGVRSSTTAANYLAWKEHARSFSAVGASFGFPSNAGASENGAPAERIQGMRFTASMWEVLGVRPMLGRVFTADEDRNASPAPVVVLSHRFWERRFGGDATIVGKTMRLDGVTTDIIGVMPEGFDFASNETDVWRPAGFSPQQLTSAASFLLVNGRLRDGVTMEQAQAEMSTVAKGLAEQFPDRNDKLDVRLQGLRGAIYDDLQRPLLVLQGTVAFVLLIACANIAGLLVARASSRRTEMAVRSSLGAGRARIVRQLLTENVLLAVAGATVGCAIGWAGLRALVAALPPGVTGLAEASIDWRVLVLTGVLSVATGVMFGLAPAIQTSSVDLANSLKESGRDGMATASAQRFRSALVTIQIGLALMLLIGAGLMGTSFLKVLRTDLGADPSNLLTFEFRFAQDELMRPVGTHRGVGLWEIFPVVGLTYERLWERLQSIPGVASAAAISRAPLSGSAMGMDFFISGRPRPPSGALDAAYFAITPRYFETMRIPILRGRDVARTDTASSSPVVIINKTMADRFWEGEDPLGQHITLDFVPDEPPRAIVGIVADSVIGRFQRQPTPVMYVPHLQQTSRWRGPAWDFRAMMAFVMRAEGDPMRLATAARAAVAEIDSGKPAGNMRTVDEYLGQQSRGLQLYATLLAIFGVVAGLLAALGVYGVMAYTVAQRTREIGIRMALGASGARVLRIVVRRTAVLVVIGLALGLAGAMGH